MKLLKPFIVLLLCLGCPVLAQEEPLAPPGTLNQGEVLVATGDYPRDHLWNITRLWLLDPFVVGGQQRLYLDLEREGYRVHDIEITRGGLYLFTLEIEGRQDTGFVPLGESDLVRMNLETGEREVMFTGINLVNFSLSPDAEQALVNFYPEDMTFVNRYDLRLREQWCVVALSTSQNVCHTLTFPEDTYPSAFEWISEDILAYTLNMAEIVYVLDTKTFTTIPIPLPEGASAIEIRRLASSKLLILDSVADIPRLLSLDLSDNVFREISQLPNNAYSVVEVSPQGNHVVLTGVPAILVNLDTGTPVQSYPTIYDMRWVSFQWLPIHNSAFLIGRLGFRGVVVMTVVFDPFTNSVVNILNDVRGMLLVVP